MAFSLSQEDCQGPCLAQRRSSSPNAVEFDPYLISYPHCKIKEAPTFGIFVHESIKDALF